MKLETILNDLEKSKVTTFLEDETLVNAVKKILLLGLYQNGTVLPGEEYDATTNFAMHIAFKKEATNEQIGADLRACAEGIRLLESGFEQLKKFKTQAPAEPKSTVNKAR